MLDQIKTMLNHCIWNKKVLDSSSNSSSSSIATIQGRRGNTPNVITVISHVVLLTTITGKGNKIEKYTKEQLETTLVKHMGEI